MSALLAMALLAAPSWGQELPELLVKIHWARAQLGMPALAGPEEELFALGVYLQGAGRNAEARAIFQTILERWPDSPDLGEVWLGVGDTHEGEGQHTEAHAAYLRASTYLTGQRRVLALDRAAWELAHQGEPERAFSLVVDALEHSFGSGQETGALFEVQREALRDLVVFAAQIDADAHPRRSPYGLAHMDTLWDLHARMAGLYRQAGELERAARIEGWLLRLTSDPTDL
jgi:tetratricopeptide (TPR) repeat protein